MHLCAQALRARLCISSMVPTAKPAVLVKFLAEDCSMTVCEDDTAPRAGITEVTSHRALNSCGLPDLLPTRSQDDSHSSIQSQLSSTKSALQTNQNTPQSNPTSQHHPEPNHQAPPTSPHQSKNEAHLLHKPRYPRGLTLSHCRSLPDRCPL